MCPFSISAAGPGHREQLTVDDNGTVSKANISTENWAGGRGIRAARDGYCGEGVNALDLYHQP